MKLHICVYLHTNFDVSSIILTSFRQGMGEFTPHPFRNRRLKSPLRLGLRCESSVKASVKPDSQQHDTLQGGRLV